MGISIFNVEDVDYGETFYYPARLHNYGDLNSPGASNDLAYGEQMEVAVDYTLSYDPQHVHIANPTKAGIYRMHWDKANTRIYESDGVTEIEDGLDNYHITYGLSSRDFYIKPLKIEVSPLEYSQANGNALQYGDLETFSYYDYVGNYQGDILSEDGAAMTLPYGERLKITQGYFKHKD